MAEQVDIYKIIVNVEGAQTIGQLEEGVRTLREELKTKEIGSKEFNDLSKAINDTDFRLQAAGESAKQAGQTMGSSFKTAAGGILSGFQAATGAIGIFANGSEAAAEAMARMQGLMQLKEGIAGITSAISSMTGLNKMVASGVKGFNLLKIAIIGTGIGILIVALGSLIAYFTRVESAVEQVERVLAGLKAGFDTIINTLADLGGAIMKAFSGDFTGAMEDASAAVSNFGENLSKNISIAVEAERAAQKLEDAEIAFITTQAELNRTIAEGREIISDENATLGEKKAALKRVQEASKQLFDEERRQQAERVRIEEERQKTIKVMDADTKKLQEEKAKLIQLDAEQAQKNKAYNRDEKRINAEARREAKERADARNQAIQKEIDLERERLTILEELTIDKEKSFAMRRLKAGIISREEYNNLILKLDKDYEKKAEDERKKAADDEVKAADARVKRTEEEYKDRLQREADYYDNAKLQLIQKLIEGEISREQYEEQLRANEAARLQAEIATSEEYGKSALDLKLKQADAEVAINKAKNDQILKDDEDLHQAKMSLAREASNILGAFTSLIVDEYGKQSSAAKAAALLQLGVDTAMAYIDGLRIAQQGAKATGPAAPFAFPIFYASQVASILTAVNKARQILGGGGAAGGGGGSAGGGGGGDQRTPNIATQPLNVRQLNTGQNGDLRVKVVVKDINDGQRVVQVIDTNSLVVE